MQLEVHDAAGSYGLTADWVLAADGARRAIRSLRGLRLKGENFEGRCVIADVQMAHDYPTIRRALFDRDGRVVFIGDSAQTVPIFGARGLNNGFADAQKIARKLAWVCGGKPGRRCSTATPRAAGYAPRPRPCGEPMPFPLRE